MFKKGTAFVLILLVCFLFVTGCAKKAEETKETKEETTDISGDISALESETEDINIEDIDVDEKEIENLDI